MCRVFSYVKEPVQYLRQILAGILHNPCRKQVLIAWLAGSICPCQGVIFEASGWPLQHRDSIPAAVVAACVRQMGVTHRAGPWFGNLLWEVEVLPKQKLEKQLIMQAAISKSWIEIQRWDFFFSRPLVVPHHLLLTQRAATLHLKSQGDRE